MYLSYVVAWVGFVLLEFSDAQCSDRNRTAYLRSSSLELDSSNGEISRGHSLESCQKLCTFPSSGVCNAFQYDLATQRCLTSSAGVQPFGPASVIPSHSSVSFYQKICIPTDTPCDELYSFDRVPQRVLVGFSHEVVPSPSVSDCLRYCLESARIFAFHCKSVMYFYETGECILNQADRSIKPELFSSDTQGLIVDYFENNCGGVSCRDGSLPHYMRSENNHLIQTNNEVHLNNVALDECQQFCDDNVAEGRALPCQSFTFDTLRGNCELLEQRSKPRGETDLVSKLGIHYYEKICLRTQQRCRNEYAFDRVNSHVLVGHSRVVMAIANLEDCLNTCLRTNCRSVMFYYDKHECILNAESRFSHSHLFSMDTQGLAVDYFDNTCSAGGTFTAPPPVTRPTEFPRPPPINPRPTPYKPTRQPFPTPGPPLRETTPPGGAVSGRLETECHYDRILVSVSFSRGTTGSVFVKNRYDSCRSDFYNSTRATLQLNFPNRSVKKREKLDCGGEEISPGVFSYTIVVQKNGFGVPGLVTNTDRIFNITCDYSDSNTDITIKNSATVSGLPPTVNVFGAGASNVDPEIRMMILRNNRPVNNVLLGEELDLKWEIENMGVGGVDYFIRECTAERLGGNPPQPAPVKLITNGCPDLTIKHKLIKSPVLPAPDGFMARMTMFRFDGSRSVKMKCSIDVCMGQCMSPNCDMSKDNGKRKKRQSLYDLKIESGYESSWTVSDPDGSVIEEETASNTFTIVDRLLPQENADFLGAHNNRENKLAVGKQRSKTFLMQGGRVCFMRPLFITLVSFLSLLSLTQVIVIFFYFWRKYHGDPNEANKFNTLKSNSSSGSGSDWYNSWHKLMSDKLPWKKETRAKPKPKLSEASSSVKTSGNSREKSRSRARRVIVDSSDTAEPETETDADSSLYTNRSRVRKQPRPAMSESSEADTVCRAVVRVETHRPPQTTNRRDALPPPPSPPSSISTDIDSNYINYLPPPPPLAGAQRSFVPSASAKKKVHFNSQENVKHYANSVKGRVLH